MNHIYSTLLHDMLKEDYDEQLILELMNEALCISTRILIDPNPELHIKEYFEKQKHEDLLYAEGYERFLKVMVYRIIAYRHDDGQGRYQSFLNLLGEKIWWHYSLRMASLRIEGHYHAQRVYLPIDFSCLHAIVEKLCANETKPDEQQAIRIYHQLTNNDTFYFKQMLSLLSAPVQHQLIRRLYQIFTTSGGAMRPLPHQDEEYERFVKLVSKYRDDLMVEGLDDDEPFVSSYFAQEMPLALDGKRLADHDAPAQPYEPDKALRLWERLYGDFLKNEWPKEMDKTLKRLNALPADKRGLAMKRMMTNWDDQLYRSHFLNDYDIGALDNIADEGIPFDLDERDDERDEYRDNLSDLYDFQIDVLNEEKMAHYVWCNAWRLNMQQLRAFLVYHQARLNFEPTGEIRHLTQAAETEHPDTQGISSAETTRQTAAPNAPTTTTTPVDAVTPTPKASAYITPRLAKDQVAWSKFVDIMQSINPRINPKSGPRDHRWKWPHIKKAFEDMGFIDRQLAVTSFATTIDHLALDGRTANSVVQSFKKLCKQFPTNSDQNIIADIKERFKPVTDILDNK